MWKKWLPWRFFIRWIARKKGFLDPIAFMSKVQSFSQPSEVTLPVEIMRLAAILVARGSLNVVAIQHNLDWNWPYWVVRQFDPRSNSFIPRAFSLTHINLTHRNWTAVGIPDFESYPIVDPRGLLTPFHDSWSLDAWVIQGAREDNLVPAYAEPVFQEWVIQGNPAVVTRAEKKKLKMESRITVEKSHDGLYCVMSVEASSAETAWLTIALRPFNPEGVSEVREIKLCDEGLTWEVNKGERVYFSEAPDQHYFSRFRDGDVYRKVMESHQNPASLGSSAKSVQCASGMATAAILFQIPAGGKRKIEIQIPLTHQALQKPAPHSFVAKSNGEAERDWNLALAGHSCLSVADKQTNLLYDCAIRTLLLHTPEREAFPGPYTYKHFWFRDAAFILHALLAVNLTKRAEKILDHFPKRQKMNGYFCSQDGEWDSNGQVLWIFRRFCELSGKQPKTEWKEAIRKGAKWIKNKRLPATLKEAHAGLFPPGFSAEHLGPNDYYYWDDFWGAEGFASAAYLMKCYREDAEAKQYAEEADHFMGSIEQSLELCAEKLKVKAMPASPYRRMDTGAIGSLAAGYPLSLWAPDDERVMQTVNHLLKHHFLEDGFFHDMSHSGINPYLTLTVAQILLRNQDARYAPILRRIQKLASPTGQWPEAVHPQTHGGCMGDGQHVWAAAEWVLMIRNCFVREESAKLILCSGVLPEWYEGQDGASLTDLPVPQGVISIYLNREGSGMRVRWEAVWREKAPKIEIRLPGYSFVEADEGITDVLLAKEGEA